MLHTEGGVKQNRVAAERSGEAAIATVATISKSRNIKSMPLFESALLAPQLRCLLGLVWVMIDVNMAPQFTRYM
jgi:hypothetical protein